MVSLSRWASASLRLLWTVRTLAQSSPCLPYFPCAHRYLCIHDIDIGNRIRSCRPFLKPRLRATHRGTIPSTPPHLPLPLRPPTSMRSRTLHMPSLWRILVPFVLFFACNGPLVAAQVQSPPTPLWHFAVRSADNAMVTVSIFRLFYFHIFPVSTLAMISLFMDLPPRHPLSSPSHPCSYQLYHHPPPKKITNNRSSSVKTSRLHLAAAHSQ